MLKTRTLRAMKLGPNGTQILLAPAPHTVAFHRLPHRTRSVPGGSLSPCTQPPLQPHHLLSLPVLHPQGPSSYACHLEPACTLPLLEASLQK